MYPQMSGKAPRIELVTVIAVMGLGVLAISMLGPVLPLYLTSIDVSPDVLGLMFSIVMVGMVFGESSWGWVADRVGLKPPLITGTAFSAVVVLSFAFTKNIPAIFAIFFVWGVLRSAIFGPGRGYIASVAPPLKKATFLAIMSVMMAASRSVGALPSGFIADNLGYNEVFYVSCGIGCIGGGLVLVGLRKKPWRELQSIRQQPDSGAPTTKSGSIFAIFRPLASQCLVAALQFFGLGVFITFLPLLATQVVGISATQVGILFTIGGIVTVVLGIPMGILADHIGKKTCMILGLLVSIAALAAIAFVESYPWLIFIVSLRSLGMALFSPSALGLLSDSVPVQRQSTVMGIYGGFCENIGVIAGAALGGFLWTAWGHQVTFLTAAAVTALGVVICLFLVKIRGEDRNLADMNNCDC